MDVGPEFFHYDRHRVVGILRCPYAHSVRDCLVLTGMVAVGGNESRHSSANNFGVVELRTAGISTRDNIATDGIHGAVREAAAAQLEIPGILMQHRWQYRSG